MVDGFTINCNLSHCSLNLQRRFERKLSAVQPRPLESQLLEFDPKNAVTLSDSRRRMASREYRYVNSTVTWYVYIVYYWGTHITLNMPQVHCVLNGKYFSLEWIRHVIQGPATHIPSSIDQLLITHAFDMLQTSSEILFSYTRCCASPNL